MGKYTPMMEQYLSIKKDYKYCLLFYRLGDFYELFFDDAIIASKELDITLTGKDCGMEERAPMCGVPFHSADGYVAKLIEKGYKVAICEQTEDPKKAKGIVKRDVIRIVTPGTVLDTNILDEGRNNYIMCLFKNVDGFGVATCDVSTGEFVVTYFEDTAENKVMDEIAKYMPSEIICNDGIDFGDQIERVFGIKTATYNDWSFDYQNANICLCNHFKTLNLCGFGIDDDRPAVCSAGALMEYLLETQKNALSHITTIKKYGINKFMVLDISSRRNLELTQTIREKSKKGSLLWVLDKTKTAMGARLLRTWLTEPLVEVDAINKRLDCVESFKNNVLDRAELREQLSSINDIERLMSKVIYATANARDLLSLKNSFKCLPDIKNAIKSFPCALIDDIVGKFDVLEDIYQLLDASINEEPPFSVREGGLIKKGYNEEVDKLHAAKEEGASWLLDIENREKEETGISKLRIKYNKVFGYYIEVTNSFKDMVPDRYIRKQTLTNCERFITPELKDMESKILSAQDKIQKLEYVLFTQVRNEIKKEVHLIQDVSKIIARVDVYQSLAMLASENSYVRPVFNDQKIMDIKEGRHGVIEKVMGHGKYVPNDVSIDENSPVVLITGPNMGGKSTYMRQVALIVIMAQIGSFVPAKYANLTIFDQIFTRIGASDDLISGQSTFMVEMLEANNALRFASEKSLILFDEIGRGTATFDGMAIAQAMIEYIASEIHCMTLFSTHYHELTFLEDKGLGIQNVHASARVDNDHLVFEYLIKKGRSNKSYGVNVAKLAKLPDEVINRANLVLETLEENNVEDRLIEEKQVQVIEKESEVEKYLKTIDPMALSPLDALSTLIELKKLVK